MSNVKEFNELNAFLVEHFLGWTRVHTIDGSGKWNYVKIDYIRGPAVIGLPPGRHADEDRHSDWKVIPELCNSWQGTDLLLDECKKRSMSVTVRFDFTKPQYLWCHVTVSDMPRVYSAVSRSLGHALAKALRNYITSTKPEAKMATSAVPGADARNLDKLDVGCWAEDKKGTSLIFVSGHESGQVIFQIYDLDNDTFYQDAMLEKEFKDFFSVPPTGKSDITWTWHDKTPFPWNRVMSRFKRPVPQHSDVIDTLSAAQKIANALNLRGRKIADEEISSQTPEERRKAGYAIMDRIAETLGALFNK